MQNLMRRHFTEALAAVLSMASTFMAPLWGFLTLIPILVLVEAVTHLAAARGRASRTDWALCRAVQKIILYLTAILLAEGMVVVFSIPHHALTFIVAFVIALREFRANINNIERATGTPIWQAVANTFNLPGLKKDGDKKRDNGSSKS
jgi:hypothetical protein